MSRTFPPRSREYFKVALFVALSLVFLAVAAVGYYATPAYTRVGYEPLQPVSFSHKLHAGDLGMDCRHCHTHVGESPHANVPSQQTCLNCHSEKLGNVASLRRSLAPLREAEATGRSIEWARVHKVPDFTYFNHAVHVKRGVSCVSCHGRIDQMEVVRHTQPLSMSWCLECHRDPAPHIRPADRVFDLDWEPESPELGRILVESANIQAPEHCSGCHR